MAVTVKTPQEIKLLREGGRRLAAILHKIAASAHPGISTWELDQRAERLILESGGVPAFKGYRVREARSAYPSSICTSLNDEVVHAIPREGRFLKEGDIIGLDIGMRWPMTGVGDKRRERYGGLVTDMALTIGIGKISSDAERLIRATREALDIGIGAARPGRRVGDIGDAISAHLKKGHFGIVRDLAGHGVGYELHEEPLIPNYGRPGTGPELREGMVIAIEPMATLGGEEIVLDDDEWTFRTADGSLAAHFEHTIAITGDGAQILTAL
ncbi:MAG: type I methionyl aminopeptidase [Candidatus Sungbacteria bacterium]|uniref:Methionine aminopeptidase n=1 Tax=Candidatus Sungiibacteriota bacterium TaxID=2750080 RepID=A0A932R080_9BACT|nr:type I methionyl aminopeptidase [Candidatus Sungbacteria bacterium]